MIREDFGGSRRHPSSVYITGEHYPRARENIRLSSFYSLNKYGKAKNMKSLEFTFRTINYTRPSQER